MMRAAICLAAAAVAGCTTPSGRSEAGQTSAVAMCGAHSAFVQAVTLPAGVVIPPQEGAVEFWATELSRIVPDEDRRIALVDAATKAQINTVEGISPDEMRRELEMQARTCRRERDAIERAAPPAGGANG
jgi:hypothetical protein